MTQSADRELAIQAIEKREGLILSDKTRRKIQTDHIIMDNVFWAIWVGFIPVPVVDFVFITAVQLKMIGELSFVYGVKFHKNRTRAIIAALSGGIVTTVLSKSSFLKLFPGLGSVSGAVNMTILGAAVTYAIGKVFVRHFESGGTILDFDTDGLKEYFQETYRKGEGLAKNINNNSAFS